ncbi:hypothetical protein [Halomonas sp. BC04]|nr:hypothetical protein Q427_14150 [Halomonas sp. BC04]
MDRQPHPRAYRELRDGEQDIDRARRLMQSVAEEERRRRSWKPGWGRWP